MSDETIPAIPRHRQRSNIAREVRARLVERFPAAFQPKGAPKIPLALGVYAEIRTRCPDISARRIAIALHDYTSGWKYLTALVDGAIRVDLDGNPASAVSAEHAAEAQRRVEKIAAKRSKRRGGRPPVQQAAE
ncbi:MAG: ProQ/FINO family protein [Alphaproteobacteria bacterium]